jgi:hypothetical protein
MSTWSAPLLRLLLALTTASFGSLSAAAQTPATAANAAPAAAAVAAVDANTVVDWSSPEGVARFERSKHKQAFFPLANHFESQENRAFCGPASATIVLNAMRLDKASAEKPRDATLLLPDDGAFMRKDMDPLFKRYTQNTFFNAATDEVKTRAEVLGKPKGKSRDGGIQLRQFHEMLQKHGLTSELHVVSDDLAEASAKTALISAFTSPGAYVVVNFSRAAIGQKGGGHLSPLAAYDDESDSFLLLDVNPNTAPWSWVKSAALIKAMRTKDTAENRGFVVLRDK